MVLDIGVDTLWHYIHCHGTRHRVTKHASNYRWCACHILPLLGGGWKYRKGGEDIVTIFSPRGENIVRYFHPGVRILGGENIVSHRQGRQAYPSRHTRRGAASLPCLMIDAGGREWAHWRTKSFLSLSFLLVLHISLSSIYITLHIFQVHTKCILCGIINYLIWFEDGYRILQLLMRLTSPMILIEQRINVCHVSAIVKHVTMSFRSMKASRLYLKWMQFPQTFYVWIFIVNLLFYSQKYLSGKSA